MKYGYVWWTGFQVAAQYYFLNWLNYLIKNSVPSNLSKFSYLKMDFRVGRKYFGFNLTYVVKRPH